MPPTLSLVEAGPQTQTTLHADGKPKAPRESSFRPFDNVALDPDLIEALSKFIPPNTIAWLVGNDFIPEAALKILSEHDEMTDQQILDVAAFGPKPPDVALSELVRALLGRKGTFPYNQMLVIRLCRIIFMEGNVFGATTLLKPVRHYQGSDAASPKTLLLPEDDVALHVSNRLWMQKPDVAFACWQKRTLFRIREADRTQQSSDLKRHYRIDLKAFYAEGDKGRSSIKAAAARALGYDYILYFATPWDAGRAIQWWKRAMALDADSFDAQEIAYNLAGIYFGKPHVSKPRNWPLVKQDINTAIYYYNIAKRRYPRAAFYLGRLYYGEPSLFSGTSTQTDVALHGVEPNAALAAKNFYIALCGGHLLARVKFIEMLMLGKADPPVSVDTSNIAPIDLGEPLEDVQDDEEEDPAFRVDLEPAFAPRSRLETLTYALTLMEGLPSVDGLESALATAIKKSHIQSLPQMIEDEKNRLFTEERRTGGANAT